MKKKEKANKAKTKRSENLNSEDRALSSELGSFGLEPPKRYRSEQRALYDYAQAPQQKERRPAEERATPQQKRSRQNKKRKMSKLKRKIIFYLILSLAIVGVIVVLSLTVLFKTTTIKIIGNEVYKNKEITAVLPIEKGDNLFLIDSKKASKKIEENLPFIYKAEIKRKLPSTVVVNITETPLVFCVENADKTFVYLDDNFKVLYSNANNIPERGIEIKKLQLESAVPGQNATVKDEKAEENIKNLIKAVSKIKTGKITSIYSKDINNNYIVYDNRITCKLGSINGLENKIYTVLTAIEKLDETQPEAKGTMTIAKDKQVYFTAE